MFDLSIQEATLIQRKTEEIKKKLDEEFIKYSPSDNTIHITVSISRNIKEVEVSENVKINSIISILNEVLSKVRYIFEIKRAEMLQEELKK
ncbi:hypothetical protein [Elizabethkingia anophelis]|uniref:Uncharacterized protein n=2 Tax=Elizabethkingia anophelis TaxID=1117645 RepID=A0AAU8V193_9FLAO|nr:hypothetical protein [Elizabethkingia anophelis]AQW89753.1 hypothetical protein BBD28_03355 [Elizabethkingia anophelis]AQX02134.1 hypothetical protein BBD32_11985 [Elizabethkingia anophelis]ATC37583.1 hypothetical protein BAZ09_015660 [Elizabethkingia anophelis R26]ATC41262.1 hypothetical protein EAAG1_015875 [Elizabethkingia anophelis Ag1]ATC44939.1 hypothetical protein CMV41_15875 [Elizabethkingia anophelis]